ncbi:MAG: hypothetical protein IJL17_10165 [Kiritimatiellae bacterium]|nr:hypothetical protein [Kiritimatiellia bacterium]
MTDEEKIIARILDVIPPRSFELTTFLTLFRVRFSEKTKTACVTCGESPELLLNKEFIEAHCQTNEHLFMLVMHELYHVILGHTTLFPRATEVRNLVFDAVINAILCSLFPMPEFTSFFTDYYPSDKMPFALLRPKGEGTPLVAESALKLLYGGSDTGTYHDVYEALLKSGCVKEMIVLLGGGASGGRTLPGDGRARSPSAPNSDGAGRARSPSAPHPLLLGSHDEENEEISQEMKDLIHKIISKWPSPDRPLQGQDFGAEEREREFDGGALGERALPRGIRRLMRRAAIPGKKEVCRRSVREMVCETATFLPDWHDRSHEAREVAFGDSLIYSTTTRLQRPSSRDNRQAFVYFDVSGSVAEQVPSVAQALLPYCRCGLCTVHVFATVVHPASARDLASRKFSSTGGTDIDCVLKHVLELPPRKRPRAAVVVTDGFTGAPDATLAARFRAAGMRLFVGLVKSDCACNQESNLSSLADKFIRLY